MGLICGNTVRKANLFIFKVPWLCSVEVARDLLKDNDHRFSIAIVVRMGHGVRTPNILADWLNKFWGILGYFWYYYLLKFCHCVSLVCDFALLSYFFCIILRFSDFHTFYRIFYLELARACVRNLDLRVQSVLSKRALGLKISGCT